GEGTRDVVRDVEDVLGASAQQLVLELLQLVRHAAGRAEDRVGRRRAVTADSFARVVEQLGIVCDRGVRREDLGFGLVSAAPDLLAERQRRARRRGRRYAQALDLGLFIASFRARPSGDLETLDAEPAA